MNYNSTTNSLNQQYLSPDQVGSSFPGLTADRLARWRWAKSGPPYSKVGRQILYKREDVEAFLAKHMVVAGDQ